ncbi:hypothetical protein D7V86_26155, partial [bacterium D16-51]
MKNHESFVIHAKKNRNVIYNGKTQNIMDAANKYKGNYRMDFMDKHGKKIECKISCIPVGLCEFPNRELVLATVYGFGAQPQGNSIYFLFASNTESKTSGLRDA